MFPDFFMHIGQALDLVSRYDSLRNPLFTQKTAYEMTSSLVGSEMCIRDSAYPGYALFVWSFSLTSDLRKT
ncbi:hypothetical protein ACX3VG_02645, partial [Escherichia coli]